MFGVPGRYCEVLGYLCLLFTPFWNNPFCLCHSICCGTHRARASIWVNGFERVPTLTFVPDVWRGGGTQTPSSQDSGPDFAPGAEKLGTASDCLLIRSANPADAPVVSGFRCPRSGPDNTRGCHEGFGFGGPTSNAPGCFSRWSRRLGRFSGERTE